MTWDQVEGNWKQMKGAVKQQWATLTDDELLKAEGKIEVVAGRIQEKYGITKEEALRQLQAFADKLKLEKTKAADHA